MSFPKFIHFKSTDCAAELSEVIVPTKRDKQGKTINQPPQGIYIYIKSKYHVDDMAAQGKPPDELSLPLSQLEEMISKETITTSENYERNK